MSRFILHVDESFYRLRHLSTEVHETAVSPVSASSSLSLMMNNSIV